jgi:hypothetical protein
MSVLNYTMEPEVDCPDSDVNDAGFVWAMAIDGLDKAIRGGVNGSHLNFLEGSWPMSQTRPDASLF